MAPTYTTTPKRALRWLTGSNLVRDIDAGFQALATDVDDKLGSAGKSIIATSEARSNTAYGLLTTPDRVQGIVLPTDGLICVAYQATWKASVFPSVPSAAIFLGANQLKIAQDDGAPLTQGAVMDLGATNVDSPLFSYGGGLAATGARTNSSDVTTGQVVGGFAAFNASDLSWGGSTAAQLDPMVGGPCYIFAAAGTYDVSVQFKSSAGTVTVKDRKLWVWTMNF